MVGGLDALAARILNHPRPYHRPFRPLLHRHLSRHFPADSHRHVLLIYMDDQIAWPQFYPFLRFAERFRAAGYVFRAARYPADGFDGLVEAADAIFLQAPYELRDGEIEGVLDRIRRLNPHAPLSFFDWFAPTDIRFADRVGDHVDFYAKKSLLRDRSYYGVEQASHTQAEAHYCDLFGLTPDTPSWSPRPDIVGRLVLAPGFATSPNFIESLLRNPAPPNGARPIDVHARFSVAAAALHVQGRVDAGKRTHWYVAMRKHARDTINGLASRYKIASDGKVSRRVFMAELESSKLCFSPFGFGELCWRDIEAVLAGSVLIKPSMEHLDCFCDIYRPGETYVPVRWDLADLDEVIARLIADPDECRAIAERAHAALRGYLAGPRLGELLAMLTDGSVRKPDLDR